MKEPVLVIMAAGMGSRFGGLKQITPVDAAGHMIIDFSLYDAWRAGFRKVVFIIKKAIEADFKAAVGARMEKYFDVRYVYQEVDRLPEGFSVPEGRTSTRPSPAKASSSRWMAWASSGLAMAAFFTSLSATGTLIST